MNDLKNVVRYALSAFCAIALAYIMSRAGYTPEEAQRAVDEAFSVGDRWTRPIDFATDRVLIENIHFRSAIAIKEVIARSSK